MITRPIDTVKYIGHAITDSFNRDVIHGDAESRGQCFPYAADSIFGLKDLGNIELVRGWYNPPGYESRIWRRYV